MARIKDSSKETVLQTADIVAVIEQRTPLRKGSGGRYTGRLLHGDHCGVGPRRSRSIFSRAARTAAMPCSPGALDS